MKTLLETSDLVNALETFGDRYHAVDVFADDLSDNAKNDINLGFIQRSGRTYRFAVFGQHGVVRFERFTVQSSGFEGLIAGAAIGSAVAVAMKQRGEGVLLGALLGLLIGGALSSSTETDRPRTRKVFAMELDPQTREWAAYDGSMLRWMKERLLPLEDTPMIEALPETTGALRRPTQEPPSRTRSPAKRPTRKISKVGSKK